MKSINLARLQDTYIKLVKAYLKKHNLTKKECAKKIAQNESIFCDLLNNKRVLSALYLLPALNGGVMAENEIYDGNAGTEKEKKFWARQQLLENVSLVQFAAEVKELGGDPAKILELHAVLLREKK